MYTNIMFICANLLIRWDNYLGIIVFHEEDRAGGAINRFCAIKRVRNGCFFICFAVIASVWRENMIGVLFTVYLF